MTWTMEGPQGNEAAKIRWELVPYTRGKGLDLGCGPYKAFPHFIGVDNGHHWGNQGVDVPVKTCEDLGLFANEAFDFVFSSHLLEHIVDTKAALKEWWRVIKMGGYLCLYLPHKDLYPNVGQPGANPDHKHDFTPDDIRGIMTDITDGFNLVREEVRSEGNEYSFFQVWKKTESGRQYSLREPWRKSRKTAAVVRYGAFGDLIQASSIFPGLRAQGYEITLYTTPTGWDIVRHDPHIDHVILQDPDQVPNHLLGEFFLNEEKKYDKFVNLCESVEGTLLAIPGRVNHTWSQEMRHKHMNVNYTEFAHDIAGVPMPSKQKFFMSDDEYKWATEEYMKMTARGPVVVFSLAGSSIHKTWPYIDTIFARILLTYPEAHIVMVGGPECKMLEAGWEEEPRVHGRSGVWSIRQSLSFASVADLVVGPETGLLNAVGALDSVWKIITLSHSSKENLTKHWKKTISLSQPVDHKVPCSASACHRMHYGFEYCSRDEETGVATCQASISSDMMWEAIVTIFQMKDRKDANVRVG